MSYALARSTRFSLASLARRAMVLSGENVGEWDRGVTSHAPRGRSQGHAPTPFLLKDAEPNTGIILGPPPVHEHELILHDIRLLIDGKRITLVQC